MLTLIVLNGQDEGRVFHLDGARASVLGRQAPHVRLHDSRISRQHCEITKRHGQWMVRDLGSSNGTGINGKRITGPTPLKEGDQLWIGRLRLVVGFTADGAEDGAPAPFKLEVGDSIGERLAAGEAAASAVGGVADSGPDLGEEDAGESAGDDAEDIAAAILMGDDDAGDDIPPPPGGLSRAVADEQPVAEADADDDDLADAWDLASDQPRTSGPPAAALDLAFDDDEEDEDDEDEELTLVPSPAAGPTTTGEAGRGEVADAPDDEDDWGPSLDEAADAAGGAPAGIGALDEEDQDAAAGDDDAEDPLAALLDEADHDRPEPDDADDADEDLIELAAAVEDDAPPSPAPAADDEVELSDLGMSDVQLEGEPGRAIPVHDIDPSDLPTARIVSRKGHTADAPPPAADDQAVAPRAEEDAEPEPAVAWDPAAEQAARGAAAQDARSDADALAAAVAEQAAAVEAARQAERDAAEAAERTARRIAAHEAAEDAERLRDHVREAAAAEAREAEARSVGVAVTEARAAAEALGDRVRADRVAGLAAAARGEENARAADARALWSAAARRRHAALRHAAADAEAAAARADELHRDRRAALAAADETADADTGDPLSDWVGRYVGGEADEPAGPGAVESIAPADTEAEHEAEDMEEPQEVHRLLGGPPGSGDAPLAHGTSELFGEGPSPRAPEPPDDPGPPAARPRSPAPTPPGQTATRRRRAVLLVAAIAIVATAGLVGYGMWSAEPAPGGGGFASSPSDGLDAFSRRGGETPAAEPPTGGDQQTKRESPNVTDPGWRVLQALGPAYAADPVDVPAALPEGVRAPDDGLFGSGVALRGFGPEPAPPTADPPATADDPPPADVGATAGPPTADTLDPAARPDPPADPTAVATDGGGDGPPPADMTAADAAPPVDDPELAGLPGLPPAAGGTDADGGDDDADGADAGDDARRWAGLPDPDVAVRPRPDRPDAGRVDPRLGVDPAAVLAGEGPQRVAFLIDGSGSMLDVLPHARAWARGAMAGLGPDDRFGVIVFRSTGDEVGNPDGLQPATAERKAAALEWLDPARGGWSLGGRSDPRTAVRTALDQGATHLVIVSHNRFARRVGRGQTPAALVKAAVGDASPRVSAVLLVHEDEQGTLRDLAEAYGGVFQWVRPRDEAADGAWLGDASLTP